MAIHTGIDRPKASDRLPAGAVRSRARALRQDASDAAAGEANARSALLEAASRAMIEARSINVSLANIAAVAGLTAPLVTYHFKTKEQLQLELVRRDSSGAMAQMRHLLAMDIPAPRKLKIHIGGIVHTYGRYPYLYDLLESLQRNANSPSAHVIRAEFVEPLMAAQRAIIEQGTGEGAFPPCDTALVYALITGAARSPFSAHANRWPGAAPPINDDLIRRYAELAADVIVGGLMESAGGRTNGTGARAGAGPAGERG